jgi:acetylglutamate/LysW-gamma-L-alpha-aminoadipate kinase
MAYCGKVNKGIVESLRRQGVDAVGLSGIDAGIWTGKRKGAIRAVGEDGRTMIIRDDLTGKVERVDADFLRLLLDSGRTPVLTPPAMSDEGVAMNVDADRAAAATAAALGADELLLLSNVPGVLRDPEDRGSLIERVASLDEVREAAKGLGAEEALAGGVARVVIGSASGASPIADARNGAGTVFEGAIA